jgi:hypothetical protein
LTAKQTAWRFVQRNARAFFVLFGFALLGYLVFDSGPKQIYSVLRGTSVYLPWILLLEVAWISFDTVALAQMYGPQRRLVPARAWIHSALVSYTMMILLPAGRAGGEVARASMLSRWAGSVAVQRSTQLQAAVLLGNSVISIPCAVAVAVAVGPGHILTWLTVGNGLATAGLAVGLSLVLKRTGAGKWLETRFPGLARVPAVHRDDIPLVPVAATCLTSLGRAIQALQYGVILLAVGGLLTPWSALLSEGIHLVGAGLGDFVPNAVGITEGAYRIFAPVLGFAEAPEKALSIALIGRFAQIAVALLAVSAASLIRSGKEADPEPSASIEPAPDVDARTASGARAAGEPAFEGTSTTSARGPSRSGGHSDEPRPDPGRDPDGFPP